MGARLSRLIAYLRTPRGYVRLAWAALATNVLIVFTGAAVRLTGSGLGCPDWPRCYEDGPVYADLQTHDTIEFTNRMLTSLVSASAFAALAFAIWRLPRRRDLIVPAAVVAGGVVSQGILGGITVRYHLAYETVMAHYMLSMVLIFAAVLLVWRATHEPPERRRPLDPAVIWGTRALLGFGGVVVFAGTAATAAGPHAGGSGTGDEVGRLVLDFKGSKTVDWIIHGHGQLATVLGLGTVALFLWLRRRGAGRDVVRAVGAVGVLIALQGVVGITQYTLDLPSELVWVHVALAASTWVALAWAAIAGAWPPSALGDVAERPREAVVDGGGGARPREPVDHGVGVGSDHE